MNKFPYAANNIPMKRIEGYKRIFNFIASAALFAFMWYEVYSEAAGNPFYRKGNWLIIGMYCVPVLLFVHVLGGFAVGSLRRWELFGSVILACICANLFVYLMICLISRRFINAVPIVLLTLADAAAAFVWSSTAERISASIYPPKRLLVIYGSAEAAELVRKMSMRIDRYIICESVAVREGAAAVTEKLQRYDSVIIAGIYGSARSETVRLCYDCGKQIYLLPEISDIIVRGAESIHLFDTPLLLCRSYGLSAEQAFVKRLTDVAVSLIGLILLSPLLAAVSIAVFAEDGGRILYRQRRLTKDGREFILYKFRSMVENAEEKSGAVKAQAHDSRITRVGRIIRRLRIDEIPQLYNVLRGEMSIVGPRPERPELAAEYEKTLPEFSFRLKMKAGLTGNAQVYGRYDTSPYDKLLLDLMYIENYSVLLDIRLMMATIKVMLTGQERTENGNITDKRC